jgi:serine/threonine-protein kinase RsbT
MRAGQSAAMKTIHAQLLEIMTDYISGINARSIVRRALEKSGGGDTVDAKNLAQVVVRLEAASQLFVQPSRHAEMMGRIRGMLNSAAPSAPTPALIRVLAESDIVVARTRARDICESLGASTMTTHKIATVVSELARNIVSYTKGGQIELIPCAQPKSVLVRASDEGPGIANLDEILNGQYKSNTGLGVGLAGSKRLAASFTIKTGLTGTRIEAGFTL